MEAGVPATGRRFTLDGIYNPDGVPLDMSAVPEREAISFMATSMVLPVIVGFYMSIPFFAVSPTYVFAFTGSLVTHC